MPRLRADVLLAVSVPLLLLGGILPWQVDRVCALDGCVDVHVAAWSGSPAWAVPLVLALAVGGGWLLLLPVRAAPTGLAALAAAIGSLGAAVVLVSLDALLFSRPGVLPYRLPVEEEFPVLAVRPGYGLAVGLLGLLTLAAAGWVTVRARHALVTPWRPPRRPPVPGRQAAAMGQGPPPRTRHTRHR
jgi:hypothetical protein